mmetsp:Transcript_56226/g.111641  ORF Transcript_56226/g.111641 Transcript_56226/m.111641 type:complete len:159 (+) Transcript_56226:492-968(+)
MCRLEPTYTGQPTRRPGDLATRRPGDQHQAEAQAQMGTKAAMAAQPSQAAASCCRRMTSEVWRALSVAYAGKLVRPFPSRLAMLCSHAASAPSTTARAWFAETAPMRVELVMVAQRSPNRSAWTVFSPWESSGDAAMTHVVREEPPKAPRRSLVSFDS